VAIRAIVGYSNNPISWFALMAAVPFVGGVILACIALLSPSEAFDSMLPIWGSSLILFVASCFLICLGILSELIKRFAEADFGALASAQTWWSRKTRVSSGELL
jgi:hypothetical protein